MRAKSSEGSPVLAVLQSDPPNSETSIASLAPIRTPTEQFFVRSHFPVPEIDLESWRLEVSGEVETAKDWTYRTLERLPTRSVTVTLECAGNGRRAFGRAVEGELPWGPGAVGTAEWTGVPLRRLLKESGVRSRAVEVVAEGADRAEAVGTRSEPFGRSLPVRDAMDRDDVLVATRMNDAPLTIDHGFPARLIVPGWYGMASVKWLTRIRLTATPFEGYFQTVKYVYRTEPPGRSSIVPVRLMRVKSLLTRPLENEAIAVGQPRLFQGKAWSGSGDISRVEIDFGDGWRPTQLLPSPGGPSWRAWESMFTPMRRGKLTVRTRATDSRGNVEPEAAIPNAFQYGYNAIPSVELSVVGPRTAQSPVSGGVP